MKGFLSFRILCYLRSGEKTGEGIAELILKDTRKKPSPGTIYPALKDMAKQGLIKGEKKGKYVYYSLTKDGRKEAALSCRYFKMCFSSVLKE